MIIHLVSSYVFLRYEWSLFASDLFGFIEHFFANSPSSINIFSFPCWLENVEHNHTFFVVLSAAYFPSLGDAVTDRITCSSPSCVLRVPIKFMSSNQLDHYELETHFSLQTLLQKHLLECLVWVVKLLIDCLNFSPGQLQLQNQQPECWDQWSDLEHKTKWHNKNLQLEEDLN